MNNHYTRASGHRKQKTTSNTILQTRSEWPGKHDANH